MKSLRASVGVVGLAVLLTGCAGGAAPEAATPTPTAEVSANQEACEAFAAATGTMADQLNSDENANDAWESVRVDMDTAALMAEGEVADRISALVDDWPKVSTMLFSDGLESMNKSLEGISRACTADGAEANVYLFQTD